VSWRLDGRAFYGSVIERIGSSKTALYRVRDSKGRRWLLGEDLLRPVMKG
jgi:hypothetical protein